MLFPSYDMLGACIVFGIRGVAIVIDGAPGVGAGIVRIWISSMLHFRTEFIVMRGTLALV